MAFKKLYRKTELLIFKTLNHVSFAEYASLAQLKPRKAYSCMHMAVDELLTFLYYTPSRPLGGCESTLAKTHKNVQTKRVLLDHIIPLILLIKLAFSRHHLAADIGDIII
jgi:hypothetical protein